MKELERRIEILTAFTVILSTINIVIGLFSTNLNIPKIDFTYLLLISLTVGIISFLIFRKMEWI